MSTSNFAAAMAMILLGASAIADELPNLGEPVTAADTAAQDLTVLPDGDGLPEGSGNAVDGAEVYRSNCMACHGEGGTDGINDRLAGGHGSLTGKTPIKTVGSFWPYATTIFDYIRRAMPYQTPGHAVTAYLLYINEVIGQNDEMNSSTLPGVRMPNRDNFVWDYAQDE